MKNIKTLLYRIIGGFMIIVAYQSKDDLQNEKGLEIYIDKILTEKAEKK